MNARADSAYVVAEEPQEGQNLTNFSSLNRNGPKAVELHGSQASAHRSPDTSRPIR